MYRPDRCIACGACAAACGAGALLLEAEGPVLVGSCDVCGDCAAACPTGATEIVGRSWSVAEVMDAIRRDVLYYDESGGGVTFSGGEPLLQPEFLEALLRACRAEGIRTAIDTCAHAPAEDVERIIPLTDAVLFDVKHVDEEAHRQATGVSNRLILENLLRVRRITAERAAQLMIRVPLIADYNDSDADMERLAGLLSALEPRPPVDLLPCHQFGATKYVRLGLPEPTSWRAPKPQRIETCRTILAAAGLHVLVRGERELQCL